jgi:asparagine synthetase B (glutamine-hydrolysing)
VPKLGYFNQTIADHPPVLTLESDAVQQLRIQLYGSLKPRILNILVPPGHNERQKVRIAVLFSGGLDCTVLARIAHDLLPADQEIDLLNVAFENPRTINAVEKTSQAEKQKTASSVDVTTGEASETISCYEKCPDRETGRKAFRELKSVCTGRLWRFVAVSFFLTPLNLNILTRTRLTCHTLRRWLTDQR